MRALVPGWEVLPYEREIETTEFGLLGLRVDESSVVITHRGTAGRWTLQHESGGRLSVTGTGWCGSLEETVNALQRGTPLPA